MQNNWGTTTKMIIELLRQSPSTKTAIIAKLGISKSATATLFHMEKRGNIVKKGNYYHLLHD